MDEMDVWNTQAEYDALHGRYVGFTLDGALSIRGGNTFDQFRATVDFPTPVCLPVAPSGELVSLGEVSPRLW